MSAKGRAPRGGGVVDYFATPRWTVARLFEAIGLPGGDWLEPAAGTGAIIRAVDRHFPDESRRWTACDIEPTRRLPLAALVPEERVHVGLDWLRAPAGKPEVIIMNPPFSHAQEFVTKALAEAPWVVALLRLNFLASAERRPLIAMDPPDVYVLPNRPSFEKRRTDNSEYAWFVWPPNRARESGRVRVLALTPKEERRIDMLEAEACARLNALLVGVERDDKGPPILTIAAPQGIIVGATSDDVPMVTQAEALALVAGQPLLEQAVEAIAEAPPPAVLDLTPEALLASPEKAELVAAIDEAKAKAEGPTLVEILDEQLAKGFVKAVSEEQVREDLGFAEDAPSREQVD